MRLKASQLADPCVLSAGRPPHPFETDLKTMHSKKKPESAATLTLKNESM